MTFWLIILEDVILSFPMSLENIKEKIINFYRSNDAESLIQTLKNLDFDNAENILNNFKTLFQDTDVLLSAELFEETVKFLHPLSSKQKVWISIERFFHASKDKEKTLKNLTKKKDILAILLKIFMFSNFLTEIVIKNPEYFNYIFEKDCLNNTKNVDQYFNEAAEFLTNNNSQEERKAALCKYKNRELLRIGARDLGDRACLKDITAEISSLAIAIIKLALQFCIREAEDEFGKPVFINDNGNINPSRFAVIGMGKLGGMELNFSSDIDVIFVYEEEGETISLSNRKTFSQDIIDEKKPPKTKTLNKKIKVITNHQFFTVLCEKLINFISEPTSEGKLFRIDVRLRPEGSSGPLVRSVESFNNYFYSQASLWEKLVYLKANPIAGDIDFGQEFLKICSAYVFSNVDINSLMNEIAHLKHRIDHEILDTDKKFREVKRGVGGIREIEFIIYLLQIIHGVKNEEVRSQNIFSVIDALQNLNALSAEDYKILKESYHFLRGIEHHLQMVDERQIHLLPEQRIELRSIAERFGYKKQSKRMPEDLFLEDYKNITYKVHSLFKKYFNIQDKEDEEFGLNLEILLREDSSPQECFNVLRRYRFKEMAIEKCIKRLAFGTQEYYLSTDGKKFFEIILPTLLNYSSQTPFPDQAIRNFDNFLESAKGISSYYAVIAENPGVLKLLLRIFGTSNYLSRILIAHPEYFDEIVDPGMIEILKYPTDDLQRFFNRVASKSDVEAGLNNLRKRRRLEYLKIGTRDVLALYSSPDLSKQMTALAEGCLNAAYNLLKNNLVQRFGKPLLLKGNKESRFCIAGMGGFGAMELTYFSDLDVIYFYEGDGETNGETKITNYEFYTSLTEELSSRFSEITPEDFLYKLDARLRPEGASAPILISASRFIEYYEKYAQVWEMLAFLRFRPLAGDIEFGEEMRRRILQIIIDRIGNNIPLNEIKTMRDKIEKNIRLPQSAFADLKKGIGGLFDIEFIIHILQITSAKKYPDLLIQNTTDVINFLKELKILTEQKHDILLNGFSFFKKIQSKIRLLFESPNNYLPDKEKLESLEVAFAFSPNQKFSILETYLKYSRQIREIFNDLVKLK